jgi:hypothetical protein
MGYLNAFSSSMPDTDKISMSIWVRIPAGSMGSPVLEFGQYGSFMYSSYISVSSSGGVGFNSQLGTTGFDFSTPAAGTAGGSLSGVAGWIVQSGPLLSTNTWHHILLSIQIPSTSDLTWDWEGPPGGPYVCTPQHVYANYSFFIDLVDLAQDGGGGHGTIQNFGTALPGDALTQGTGTYSATSSELFQVSSFEVGIPVTFADAAANVNDHIDLAEYQVWFGTFLDFTNAGIRAMFIDNHSKPVDPAIPARAFGTQSILLRRNRDLGLHFTVNEGTGDSLGNAGTIADFTPGPGQ